MNGQLITSADQPEELVYEITKALWNDNTRKLLDKGHAKGKVITKETALKGVLFPLNPGAEKVYKEAGLLKLADTYRRRGRGSRRFHLFD